VFFVEPLTIHFIKEISREINLAPTSVRAHINTLLKLELIKRRESKPFHGFVANRDNEEFLYYKRVYNLYSLRDLSIFLIRNYYPKLLVVYGSYAMGEDTEGSDIDIVMVTKAFHEKDTKRFEERLKRRLHLIVVDKLTKLEPGLLKKLYNGILLYGSF